MDAESNAMLPAMPRPEVPALEKGLDLLEALAGTAAGPTQASGPSRTAVGPGMSWRALAASPQPATTWRQARAPSEVVVGLTGISCPVLGQAVDALLVRYPPGLGQPAGPSMPLAILREAATSRRHGNPSARPPHRRNRGLTEDPC